MSIENSKVIDIVGRSKDNEGEIILTISDHLEWSHIENHLHLLQEKINMYLAFIEDGEILERYPDAKNCLVVIKVVGKYPLIEEAEEFYKCASEVIEGAGFELRFSLFEKNK